MTILVVVSISAPTVIFFKRKRKRKQSKISLKATVVHSDEQNENLIALNNPIVVSDSARNSRPKTKKKPIQPKKILQVGDTNLLVF